MHLQSFPDCRKIRSLVPEPPWIRPVSAADFLSTTVYLRKIFGEHGDTSFVPWSRAFVAGATLDEFDKIVHEDQKDLPPLDREEVLEYVHTSGSTVIAKKGATFYAVAVSVCRLCSLLLAASDTIVSVSTMLHGEYGIEDVCLSTMASIGPNGVKRIVRVPLTEEETEKLHASANALKDVIAQIDL